MRGYVESGRINETTTDSSKRSTSKLTSLDLDIVTSAKDVVFTSVCLLADSTDFHKIRWIYKLAKEETILGLDFGGNPDLEFGQGG